MLLVGNQMAPAFDNPEEVKHHDRDPLMVSVSPDGYRFEKAFARGGGGQYPSALVAQDALTVLYSMGKEDVWCCSVPLRVWPELPAPGIGISRNKE